MTLDNEDIKAIADAVVSRLSGFVIPDPSPLSVGQQALMLARQGKVEESKALLRAHSAKRGKA